MKTKRIEMLRIVIFSFLVAFAFASGGEKWKYGATKQVFGPQDWNQVSAHCSESGQSPINIDTNAAKNDPDLKGLKFTCDNNNGDISGTLTNNGHAPTLSIDKSKGTATLTGGPLGGSVYKLEQFHFHFGCEDDKGSEHTVNGLAFSGELHLVTYNMKYPDFNTAADKPDGLSVIGVLLKRNDAGGNWKWRTLSQKISQINEAGASVAVNNLSLYKMVPALKDLSKVSFFSYKGSLTTPPCYQSVSWIVLKTPVSVHHNVLKVMRNLHYCGNFRPTQPLNGRTVSVSEYGQLISVGNMDKEQGPPVIAVL